MWNCSVCNRRNNTPFCPVCGFDHSADAESAPTLSVLSHPGKSAAGLRREREATLLCSVCGSDAFRVIRGQASPSAPIGVTKTIVAIAPCKSNHTIVLRSDGTASTFGANKEGERNVEEWKDLTAVSAGSWHSLGLKRDGTAVAAGNHDDAECNVGAWCGLVQLAGSEDFTADSTPTAPSPSPEALPGFPRTGRISWPSPQATSIWWASAPTVPSSPQVSTMTASAV